MSTETLQKVRDKLRHLLDEVEEALGIGGVHPNDGGSGQSGPPTNPGGNPHP